MSMGMLTRMIAAIGFIVMVGCGVKDDKVAVSKMNTANLPPPDPNADQTMPTEAQYATMQKSAPKPLVAEKFTDPEKSGIVIDVVKGLSSVDINVTSK